MHPILLIYIGTLFYTLASYLHLGIQDDWTFQKAFILAIPLVIIEYQFSLRGNRYAHTELKLNAIQIILITMVFYFVNTWLLNIFVLKHQVVVWRELLAFVLILSAFYVTTSIKR